MCISDRDHRWQIWSMRPVSSFVMGSATLILQKSGLWEPPPRRMRSGAALALTAGLSRPHQCKSQKPPSHWLFLEDMWTTHKGTLETYMFKFEPWRTKSHLESSYQWGTWTKDRVVCDRERARPSVPYPSRCPELQASPGSMAQGEDNRLGKLHELDLSQWCHNCHWASQGNN